ncbi:MAG: DUF808 domain-containing protein [Sulfuricurvum sp.]|nr:DUF808 domain-containing protein [Sulfuricurvum sp.]
MAGSSLLILIDDITLLLDDVAAMSKVAAKKTAGVLGDDLALNAQQVSGIRAERELPVVWGVAKGSFKNKLILVPAALGLSVLAPWSITPILMIGGAYLCFEGFEKIAHPFFTSAHEEEGAQEALIEAFHDPDIDLETFEKEKIEGAIRTDFILSAEIIVIALGTVADKDILTQTLVVSGVAVAITIGVYGIVAAIVKMDDVGLYLLQTAPEGKRGMFKRVLGSGLLNFAPRLMKLLTIVGTAAMFLVGGGILLHGFTPLHPLIEAATATFQTVPMLGGIIPLLVNGIAGVIAGGIVMGGIKAVSTLYKKLIK